ncbi:MAG: hypothetical protein ACRC28_05075 [Clostridium sp.]|uniref:hypothetical protein n=1 Tax=Clostridium sp. TaxID=1506 RepID=UPI003F3AF8E2
MQKIGKWEVGSGKWEVGSGKWEVGSGKWEVGSGKWEVEGTERNGENSSCIFAEFYYIIIIIK